MNKSLKEFKEINGMEIAKRKIYAKTYQIIFGNKVLIDEENLGVPYNPADSDGKEVMAIVEGMLWGRYSAKEFYMLSAKSGFVEGFANDAAGKYKRLSERSFERLIESKGLETKL